MRDLVRDPERQQRGREAHAVRLRVRPSGEMLEADERDPAPADDQLSRIRAADAHHEVEIHRAVGLEQVHGPAQRVLGHGDDVHVFEQAPEVGAVGAQRRLDDRRRVRGRGIENVVLPVGTQNGAMAIEVLVVCRGTI